MKQKLIINKQSLKKWKKFQHVQKCLPARLRTSHINSLILNVCIALNKKQSNLKLRSHNNDKYDLVVVTMVLNQLSYNNDN